MQSHPNVTATTCRKVLLESIDLSNLSEEELAADFYPNLEHPEIAILCDSCHANISALARLTTGLEDYCPGCFAKLPHFPHQYWAISCLDILLFADGWRAAEELELVRAIGEEGCDWEAVADRIDSDKEPDQASQHYLDLYLNTHNQLPSCTADQIIRVFHVPIEEPCNEESAFTNATPTEVAKRRRRRRRRQMRTYSRRPARHQPSDLEVKGYYPKRGEFDLEQNNEAELLLADLEFLESDTGELTALKLEVILNYNSQLAERNRIKDFIQRKQLLDLEHQLAARRDKTKTHQQLEGMMKAFQRFSTREQHETMLAEFAKKIDNQARLAQLREMQRMGLKKLSEDEEQRPREQERWEIQRLWDLKKTRRGEAESNQSPTKERPRLTLNPGYHIEKQELGLCQRLNLHPVAYLLIKQTILREHMLKGTDSKAALTLLFNLPAASVESICRLLAKLTPGLKFTE